MLQTDFELFCSVILALASMIAIIMLVASMMPNNSSARPRYTPLIKPTKVPRPPVEPPKICGKN